MLTVANIYRLHALKFIHAWHKGVLPEPFNYFFQYASNVHNYNTTVFGETKSSQISSKNKY